MEIVQIGFILTVFGAGILSFFSPCILPLLPVYMGYLSTDAPQGKPRQASLIKALAFTAGISGSLGLLGAGAGSLGQLVNSPWFFLLCGLMVIVLGIYYTGLLPLPFLDRERSLRNRKFSHQGLTGAFLLGFLFSFGWIPCVGPVLGAVLGFSSQQGSVAAGTGLLLVYALGLSLPFIILSLGTGALLTRLRKFYPHFGKIRLIGGVVIMLMGLWMVVNQLPLLRAGQTTSPPFTQEQAGENPIHYLPLTGMQGDTLTLAELQGKIVYMKFWGTWCPSCLAGLKDLDALAAQYASVPDVAVITIVAPGLHGEVSSADFREWAAAQKLSFPIYFDETGDLNRAYGVRAYPTAVYLDRGGNVLKQTMGNEPNPSIAAALTEYAHR